MVQWLKNTCGNICHRLLSLGWYNGSAETEQALKRTSERFELAMTNAGIGFWDRYPETDEVYYDKGYAAMLGFGPEELHGHASTWERQLHPEDRARVLQSYEDFVSGRNNTYRVEMRLRTKSGE